jgi:hypothetical protein
MNYSALAIALLFLKTVGDECYSLGHRKVNNFQLDVLTKHLNSDSTIDSSIKSN